MSFDGVKRWLNDQGIDKYTGIFSSATLFSLIIWAFGIFVGGVESNQFKLFFARCDDLFADFTNVCGYSASGDVYRNEVNGLGQKAYPPLFYVVTNIFSRLDSGVVPAYTDLYMQPRFLMIFILFLFFIMVSVYAVINNELQGSTLKKYILSISIVFSGGIIFVLERANAILLGFFFIMLFWFWHDNKNRFVRELSLLALGIAVAFRLSPAALVLILIYKKRFTDAGKVIIYGMFLFFIPFLYFDGGLSNFFLMLSNMHEYFLKYGNMPSMALGSPITMVINKFFIPGIKESAVWLLMWRFICLGSTALIVGTAWAMKRKWERCLAISMVLLLVPTLSHAYCALYLIPALVFFLNEKQREGMDILCLIGFILICWTYMLPIKRIDYLAQCQLAMWFFYIFTMIKSVRIFKDTILTKKWGTQI